MTGFNLFGVTIQTTEPYKEGHPLTAVEAERLNSLRQEMIYHLLARWTKTEFPDAFPEKNDKGEPKGKPSFTEDQLAQIAAQAKAIDEEYEFSAGSKAMDEVEKEARAIARQKLEQKLAEKGLSKAKKDAEPGEKEISHEAYNRHVLEIAQRPAVRKAAKANVNARAKIGDDDIGDIL